MKIQPVLSSIAYSLGEAQSIHELVESDAEALAKVVNGREFECFLKSENRTAYQLAEDAIEQSLASCELTPEEIDTVIFATDSFKSVKETMEFFAGLCARHQLDNAYPVLVSMSECANFHVALELAVNAINTGSANNVLLVTTDKAELASPYTRLVGGGIGVMSDAAASCVISSQVEDGFAIESISKVIAPELIRGEVSGARELMIRVDKNSELFELLFDAQCAVQEEFADIKAVIASNISSSVLSVFMSETGLKHSQIMTDNHARLGHCLASDCLINLLDYVADKNAKSNERFLLYGAGPITWGGAILRATTYMDTV
jgi:3-oxoacyl-[acyl-carrier-protein] synthase-3